MERSLQEKLYQECPLFFSGFIRGQGGYYGICIRDDWFQPFKKFCHKVEKLNQSLDAPIVAERIKEKFFELRVYTNYSTSDRLFSKDVIFTDDVKKQYADAFNELVVATEMLS